MSDTSRILIDGRWVGGILRKPVALGLGASVYTKSLELAMRAMERVKAGTFWVNDPLTDNDGAPFGGMRWSGVGRELGEEGLDAFREPKHVHVDYLMETKNYWYPYRERKHAAD